MKNIWLNLTDVIDNECYIYGDGYNAEYMNNVLKANGIDVTGFIRAYSDADSIDGKPVISLDDIKDSKANILLTQRKQMDFYDYLFDIVEDDRIYTTANVKKSQRCIFCNNERTIENGADFAMFLRRRMFNGENKQTAIVHCPKCGVYYSKYRPNDNEMGLLYSGYRGEEYFQMRHEIEPGYTRELNDALSAIDDRFGRKGRMYKFIKDEIDEEKINTVVDFGGDRGQFIPDEFLSKRRIVYEISGVEVVDGIELITDYDEIKKCNAELVLCNQVLEHLSYVREYLESVAGIVAKGGFLYIEVPYERWCVDEEYVHFHEHINYYCEKTFVEMVKLYNNLSLVKVERMGNCLHVLIKKK